MRRLALLLAVPMLVGACRERAAEDAHDDGSGASHRHEEENLPETAEAGANLLRIDSGMLRDLRLTTTKVESRRLGEGEAMLGEIRVDEDEYAEVTPIITGVVTTIVASAGQRVAVGDRLAELESAELGRARAEYRSAAARLDTARRALERRRRLAEERIIAARQVEETAADAAAAAAALGTSETILRAFGVEPGAAAGRHPSRFALRAPIAGEVIERDLVLGRTVPVGAVVFRVANLSTVWLIVQAFERDAVRVTLGSTAKITIPALPGRGFDGKVTFVGREVDVSSRTVPVRIEIANGDGILRPGMSATAFVPLGDDRSLVATVPAVSLQQVGGTWVGFLPRGDGVFEMRSVGRGRDLGGEIEILSGLRPGETVVASGAFLLKAEAEKSRGEGGENHHH